MTKNWKDSRVLILGAARQGQALARFMCQRGAAVTLNDQNPAEKLTPAMEALADYPVKWVTGGHPVELLEEHDLVCLSGGIPETLPIVQEALRRGIPITNDSQIFMEEVPCRVIGITGSAGKTTTTTLVGRMASRAVVAPQKAWVGGNIGVPLIDRLDEIQPADVVVLELSSFQLQWMTRSPQVAAVLNITPNHLDRHGTMEAYTAAKARILEFQSATDIAVLGREDAGAWGLREKVRGDLISFGLNHPAEGKGTFYDNGWLWYQGEMVEEALFERGKIALRGTHNLLNVLAACAIGIAAGFPPEALLDGVQGFGGVPHRLELVREWRGVRWYNDSIATAPERTIAAIRSFEEPLVLMLGGRDKKLPWDSLADLIHERVDHVVVFGEAAEKIAHAIGEVCPGKRPFTLTLCKTVQEAVQAAAAVAEEGDVVLFSPGGTSYDEFRDFEERGERFRKWVQELL